MTDDSASPAPAPARSAFAAAAPAAPPNLLSYGDNLDVLERHVADDSIGLLPALYLHLNPLDRKLATGAEVALPEALAEVGIRVKQG
jgi:hypothetical protein